MVAEAVAAAVVLLATVAELLHRRRSQRLATLAFGPAARPNPWARAAPLLRVAALGAVSWGLVTLALLTPKIHETEAVDEQRMRHLLLVLDVSPSMRLEDAGPTHEQARMQRAADLIESLFKRIVLDQYRVSVVAVYNGAKPVVVDTRDREVVRNILNDLPMHYAFQSGETKLFDGLEEAARLAKPWNPKSATVVVISDGDTVPATGIPRMPASVAHVLVVGVGDPRTGKFIDGRQSRQDVSTLRQIAARLRGTYHNGNEKHISSDTLALLTQGAEGSPFEKLSRREYALIACAAGAGVYALLPLLLHFIGTSWRPGVTQRRYSLREAPVDRGRQSSFARRVEEPVS